MNKEKSKENNWLEKKESIIFHLNNRTEFFLDRLSKMRSNKISLELIQNLTVSVRGEKKKLKFLCNVSLYNEQLLIKTFESNLLSAVIEKIINEQIGYKLEKSAKGEAFFSLLPVNEETRKRIIDNVRNIVLEEKNSVRNFRQEIKNWIKKSINFSQDQKKKYENELDVLIKLHNERLNEFELKKINNLSSF